MYEDKKCLLEEMIEVQDGRNMIIEENHGRCHEISRERTIQATAGHVKGLGFTKDIASKRVMCFNLNFQGFTLSMDWEKQKQKQSHCTTAITEVRHGASLN